MVTETECARCGRHINVCGKLYWFRKARWLGIYTRQKHKVCLDCMRDPKTEKGVLKYVKCDDCGLKEILSENDAPIHCTRCGGGWFTKISQEEFEKEDEVIF